MSITMNMQLLTDENLLFTVSACEWGPHPGQKKDTEAN